MGGATDEDIVGIYDQVEKGGTGANVQNIPSRAAGRGRGLRPRRCQREDGFRVRRTYNQWRIHPQEALVSREIPLRRRGKPGVRILNPCGHQFQKVGFQEGGDERYGSGGHETYHAQTTPLRTYRSAH